MKDEDNQIEVNNDPQIETLKDKPIQNPFNDNDQITLNDTNDTNDNVANVVSAPVPISTSAEQVVDIEIINDEASPSKLQVLLSPIMTPFLKLGKYFQNLISNLSEKVNIEPSYKYFLIFLALGLLFFFFAVLYIPFAIFNPGKLLRLLSLGNICIMLSFLFHYGSKDFFAFVVDEKRTCIMFGHISMMLCSLFVSLILGGYFLQLLLDIILGISTVMFILTLVPGGQGGIAGIKRMLISPLLLLFNMFKGKIFGDEGGSVFSQ